MMKPELINCFKTYQKRDLLSDLFAALMVTVVALPLSIAMGIQSGATLQIGLMTAIVGGFFISAFGGSKFSIGGPSATFIALSAALITDPQIGINGLFLATVFAGAILIVAGFFKAGKLLSFVPNTVVIGITAGIGVMLLFGQFKDFFGLTPEPVDLSIANVSLFVARIIVYAQAIGTFQWASFVIGALALCIIYLLPKINKKIPSLIIAITVCAMLSAVINANFPNFQIATIGTAYGEIKPEFNFIDFSALNPKIYLLIYPAFTIALISALEGLMSASVAESLSGKPYDPNMELVAHGLANIGTGFCGALPATGALARTNVNITSGAKSPLAGIFQVLMLLLTYLLLMPLMAYIPLAALAAALVKVSINMSRFRLSAHLLLFGKRDFVTLLAAFLLTAFFGVMYGVLAGIAIAYAMNAKNFKNKPTFTEIHFEEMKNHKDFNENFDLEGDSPPSITAFHLKGAIFFANVNQLIRVIKQAALHVDEIILDMEEIVSLDATAVERLARLAKSMSKNGKRLVLYNISKRISKRYLISFEHIIYSWR